MGRRIRATLGGFACLIASIGCEEDNPFRSIPEGVSTGQSRIWELALPAFPSVFDFTTGEGLFIGAETIGSRQGDFVLDSRPDGTLVFVPFSAVAGGLTVKRTGFIDLGPIPFESVEEAPEDGYSAVGDSTGVPVIEGHVYALRVADLSISAVPINYGKIEVLDVGVQRPDDPRSRFVRFLWSYQLQPLNRRVVVTEG